MNRKVISYLGFAKKSGNLLTGVNTCSFAMAKGKVKLMILAEDISENSRKKIMKEIRKYGVNHIEYGNSEELSHCLLYTSYTASPSYKSIKTSLLTGSVKMGSETTESRTTQKAHGITRGADYYRR